MKEVKRILVAMPQTAGDVFICTGLLPAIHAKWPDALIYFATEERYFDILDRNPFIHQLAEYHKSMQNYRLWETWGPNEMNFDIVYHPNIVTQHIPHWIHGGHGEYLGHVYARMCDLDAGQYGPQFLATCSDEEISALNLPDYKTYVTIHAKTNQDPKDYSYMQEVVERLQGVQIVQIGGKNDPKLDGVALDLRGKTTPQELSEVLRRARLHIGLDSFPMHVANYVDTPSVIMFGGTYAKQGLWPAKEGLITALEPTDRFLCSTSCHLIECEMKKRGVGKCIDNISVEIVMYAIGEAIGMGHIVQSDPIKISAYMILRDGIKYGFPYRESIQAAAAAVDEVVVVDGGSGDGTLEDLRELEKEIPELRVFTTKWDVENNPTLFGDEKTHARRCCEVGNYLLQLDADEIIYEPYPGALRELVQIHRDVDVLDMPVINFYGGDSTIRVEPVSWKWRVSKADPRIIHGVNRVARALDQNGRVVMDKSVSDGCEYIYSDNLMVCHNKPVFPLDYEVAHQNFIKERDDKHRNEYVETIKNLIQSNVVVFHYSWHDLKRKTANGEFWNKTWHGKQNATHNTTADITDRIQKDNDLIISININHPLKGN